MRSQGNFSNRICYFLLVMVMLLSLVGVQPAAADETTPVVILADGTQITSGTIPDPLTKIEQQVLDEINTNGVADFFVWVRSKIDLSPANRLDGLEARGQFVFTTLEEGARTSQAGVTEVLLQAEVKFESYTIVNRVLVRGGTGSLAQELASRPDVDRLTANHSIQLVPLRERSTETNQVPDEGTTLSFTGIDQVWKLGFSGDGIVLAGLDTGIQWDAPALINHYRGWNGSSADHNYNWWDATGSSPTAPKDGNGQGTQSTGSMVGDDSAGNPLGVAPGAKTIHCKGFDDNGLANDAALLTCFQWFLAPWDLNHLNPDPAMAPNVIYNSWDFSGDNKLTFVDAIDALQTAGILVVASVGEAGSDCQTPDSPSDPENILTTNLLDHVSRLAGSPWNNNNTADQVAPTITGLVGLIWQAAPSLKGHIPETIAAIKARSDPLTGLTSGHCPINDANSPDKNPGTETIDVKVIIDALTEVTISSRVTEAASAAPLAGVLISAGSYQTTTGEDGTYTLSVLAGTYTITAQKGGYASQSKAGIVLSAGSTPRLDFELSAAGLVTVHGVVRDGTPSGHTYPLYAKIAFDSFGLTTVSTFSDPFTGAYSAGLLQSTLYTAKIAPILPGYTTATVNFTPTTNPYTMNFTVQADLPACNTPGYSISRVLYENFDLAVPPALPSGWTQADVGISTGNWATANTSYHPAGIVSISSPNMVIFNSYTATSTHKTLLYTNFSTSLTSLSNAILSFWMYHDSSYTSAEDKVEVAVSTNGSAFFLTGSAFLRYSPTPGWVHQQVDISSYAGPGKPPVYIGLMGTSAYGNDIHIDDISISLSSCAKLYGGLVSGFVSSFPSGRPVISAQVARAGVPSETTFSMGRGEDAALADGLYQVFSTGTGSQGFTATAIRHHWNELSANVVNDSVARLDLSLTYARPIASPNPFIAYLAVNTTSTANLTISNPGSLVANFTIQPAASALTSGSTQPTSLIPYNEEPANDPTVTRPDAAAGDSPSENTAMIEPSQNLGGGARMFGVTTPFPGTAGYRFATASCNGDTFYVIGGLTGSTAVAEVWMYDPTDNSWTAKAPLPSASGNMRAACIDGKIYVVGGYSAGTWKNTFQVYNTLTNSWGSSTQPVTGGPMVVAYNGLLYAMGGMTGSGASKLAYVYTPASSLWTPLADLPTAAAYSGALVYKNLIFIIGGSDTSDVQVYNPATNTWNNSGPNLPGARMDPVVGWYGDQIYLLNGGGNGNYFKPYPEGYVLNASAWPAGSWTLITSPLPDPQSAPASICAGNRLWSVAGTISNVEDHITQYYDNGLMCNRTYAPVPWLTVTPQSGFVNPAGSTVVSLGFSANFAPYNNPGVYHAMLKFNSDAPTVMLDIPVTMLVAQTNAAVYINPYFATKPVFPHRYTSYDFTITNTSGATESFVMAVLGISPGWTAVVSPSGFTNIPNFGSATMNVKLYPPGTAKNGDEGVVTLAIRVHDNASKSASLSAIGIVQFYKDMLPLVIR